MLQLRIAQSCFGGTIGFYGHASLETGAEMRFAVYVPPLAGLMRRGWAPFQAKS